MTSSSGSARSCAEPKALSNGPSSRRLSLGGADNLSKLSLNGVFSRRSPSFQMKSSLSASSSMVLKHAKGTSKSFDGGTRSLDRGKVLGNGAGHLLNRSTDIVGNGEINDAWKPHSDDKPSEGAATNSDSSDMVSGLLYDMLQKEVITLRKSCNEKDQSLKDKDDAIEVEIKYYVAAFLSFRLFITCRQIFVCFIYLTEDASQESRYVDKSNGGRGQKDEERGCSNGKGGCCYAWGEGSGI
jgi:Microtubule-associated protein 70